jgi:hypothetical protein
MRRLATVLAIAVLAILVVAAPALAFYHDHVHNLYLHTLLDLLTLAVISAPIIGLSVWRGHVPSRQRKRAAFWVLLAMQLPAGLLAFASFPRPWLQVAGDALSLSLTGWSLWFVRRWIPADQPAHAVAPSTAAH